MKRLIVIVTAVGYLMTSHAVAADIGNHKGQTAHPVPHRTFTHD